MRLLKYDEDEFCYPGLVLKMHILLDLLKMKSPQIKPVRLLQERHQENLEIMLKNLLKDEILSDVTIHCKDGSVRAHRVILAASSSYFRKLFQDHPDYQVAFLIHGIGVKQMKSLIELIYRGSTQIPSDMMTKLCDMAEEFGMKGIIDENDKSLRNTPCRDTRFKGQKRVTVDFEKDSADSQVNSLKCLKNGNERSPSGGSEKSFRRSTENLVSNPWVAASLLTSPHTSESPDMLPTAITQEPSSPVSTPHVNVPIATTPLSAEARRKNNWAMKQRKYKCTLCPASFKRASHLSRHQLVHTGERPYVCDQCDKAFSRHDKLKHHIRRTHSPQYVGNLVEMSPESNLYTMGQVEFDNSLSDIAEEPARVTREDLLARMPVKVEMETETPPDVSQDTSNKSDVVPEPCTTVNEDSSGNVCKEGATQKKGRGRPRKYPLVPKPLIKRPRGRPRLSQSVTSVQPQCKTIATEQRTSNYDITNMPFGDLDYLTKPIQMERNSDHYDGSNNSMEGNFMEPLVEIEMDQNNYSTSREDCQDTTSRAPSAEESASKIHNAAGAFLQNIGLLETSTVSKMNIGECTISVSNESSSSKN